MNEAEWTVLTVSDEVEAMTGMMFDITERRAADELRVAREMLEASRARIIAAADEHARARQPAGERHAARHQCPAAGVSRPLLHMSTHAVLMCMSHAHKRLYDAYVQEGLAALLGVVVAVATAESVGARPAGEHVVAVAAVEAVVAVAAVRGVVA